MGECEVKAVECKGFIIPLKVTGDAAAFPAGAEELPALLCQPQCSPSKAELAGAGEMETDLHPWLGVSGQPPTITVRAGLLAQEEKPGWLWAVHSLPSNHNHSIPDSWFLAWH